ncbi:hypothetical protein HDC92_004289 [Pedobacter sp. AK017]|uniref:hypothetical protein n=1 Tax=Pedobacter sp. AK017 TaxID=2723073 RepID=UPI00160E6A55|nr:hypothetical protein [Pedobacter sp. AK017]MBB5440586.1 hypothetical protein [Pedobacter sp. AK017]
METQKGKGSRRHRSDKEILEAIAEFGDLSMAEFCELFEITDSTYYNWQNKCRQMELQQGKVEAIQIVDDVPGFEKASERLTAELRMPDGRVWRLFGHVDGELIKHLN